MKIINDFLYDDDGQQVSYIPSPNRAGTYLPKYLIMHGTETTDAASTIDWFTNPESQVSAHLLIARNGIITQFVPFDQIAWHAGQSSWNSLTSLNRYAIGIELVNAGRLSRVGKNWICTLSRKVIPPAQVVMATHRNESAVAAWQNYSLTQVNTALAVGRVLADYYQLLDVIGHDDVSPGRKSDPGPAFPMPRFRSDIF